MIYIDGYVERKHCCELFIYNALYHKKLFCNFPMICTAHKIHMKTTKQTYTHTHHHELPVNRGCCSTMFQQVDKVRQNSQN